MKNQPSIVGLIVGICATPVALSIGGFSAGAGHGGYLLAKLLFPFTMLSTVTVGSITMPLFLLALAQFPTYGWLIGSGVRAGTKNLRLWFSVTVHVSTVALNFIIPNSNFS